MKRIETKNILLREFKTDDAKQAFDNQAGIKKNADLSDFKVHSSVDETKQMIEIGLGDGEGERYTLAIIFKETEEVAVFIRIYDISKKIERVKLNLQLERSG